MCCHKYVLKGTEKAAILADASLTNEHLIQHCFWGKGGFPSFDMYKKIIFIRNYALINWCSKDFSQRLSEAGLEFYTTPL